jgi:hypothetical protein
MIALRTVLVALLMVIGGTAMSLAGGKKVNGKLDHADELAIRSAVYKKQLAIAMPTSGKWAFLNIVAVPEEIEKAYKNKPKATVDLLVVIGSGAAPADSKKAIAYALALVDNPSLGVPVLAFTDAEWDTLMKVGKQTHRQFFLSKIHAK